MQPKIDKVVELLRDIRPHLTKTVSPTSPASQAVAQICPPIDSAPPDGSALQAPRLASTSTADK
jgi:hypothetical protein